MSLRPSQLCAQKRQCGKVIILALVASLLIAWQTFSVLEIGWNETRLLNNRIAAVRTRQAALSLSTAILRELTKTDKRNQVAGMLSNVQQIEYCLTSRGELANRCTGFFDGDISTNAVLTFQSSPLVNLGVDWLYFDLVSRAQKDNIVMKETISFSVKKQDGQFRIQKRLWLP